MKVKEINLFGCITDDSVGECIKSIQDTIETESKKLPEDRKHIMINVFSDGGSVDAMLALCDIIEKVNKEDGVIKIHTHLLRKAYSAGFPIWLCGFNRTLSNSAEAMYHDISYASFGSVEEHKDHLDRSSVVEGMFDRIIIENFKITKEEMISIKRKRKNHYFSRDEIIKRLKVGYRRYAK